jgi:hypothetical protein
MINPNNQYQGFTGSNYDEDDLERAKAGGFVRFDGNIRNSVLQNIINSPNDLESKRISDILSSPDANMQEYKKLSDIHNQMVNRDKQRMSILNKAASENPGIETDLKNQRMDHFEEFMNAYPEYKKLMDEGEEDRNYYMNSPLGQQHMKSLLQKEGESALRGHDFTEDQFTELQNFLSTLKSK